MPAINYGSSGLTVDEFANSTTIGEDRVKADSLVWEKLHPAIRTAAQPIAEAGTYDDAIFAAFRHVEAEIQERINSRSVGEALLNEAFDGVPPKVLISADVRDQEGIEGILAGALGNIRSDRGLKKAPSLPCPSIEVAPQATVVRWHGLPPATSGAACPAA